MRFDFESIKTRAVEYLQEKSEWAEVLPDSVDMRLIDAMSFIASEIARYDENLSRERKWRLASNRSSLVAQTPAMGYRPHRKIGAIGKVAFSVSRDAFTGNWVSYRVYSEDDTVWHDGYLWKATEQNSASEPEESNNSWDRIRTIHPVNVPIPKYTQLTSSGNGLSYVTVEPATMTPSDDYIEVSVVQGQYRSIQYTANGDLYEEVEIEEEDLEEVYYEVYVNDVKIREIDSVYSAESTDLRFDVRNDIDYQRVFFRFGDGINGRKLNEGDEVRVQYIVTDGDDGNINSRGGIDTLDYSISDVNGDSIDLKVYNFDALLGGKNIEDIETIRQTAPAYYQAGDRIVSAKDYQVFLEKSFPFIGKAVVWGAYEQHLDRGIPLWEWLRPEENFVYVSAITPGSTPVDAMLNIDGSYNDTNRVKVIEEVLERKPPRDIIRFEPVQFVYWSLHSKLFVSDPTFLIPEVIEDVQKQFQDRFGVERMQFKQNLYDSRYKEFISQIPGVEYHQSYVRISGKYDFQERSGSEPYSALGILPLENIKPNTVEIRLIYNGSPYFSSITHKDDGSGGWKTNPEGSSQFAISGGNNFINYSTGAFEINITGGGVSGDYQDWEVWISYERTDIETRLESRNQILYLNDVSDITGEYV